MGALIEDMAFQVYSPPYYPIPPPDYSTMSNSNRKSQKDIIADDSLSSYDQSSSSAASTCSSMSTGGSSSMSSTASSTSSSGTTTPQKPPTPGPVIQNMTAPVAQQVSPTNYHQIHRHTHSHPPPPQPMTSHHMTNVPPPTTLPAVAITNQPPASVHHVPSTLVGQQQQISSTNMTSTSAVIPTYEIVTSCQPAVIYSNGYYYTSFLSHPLIQPLLRFQ